MPHGLYKGCRKNAKGKKKKRILHGDRKLFDVTSVTKRGVLKFSSFLYVSDGRFDGSEVVDLDYTLLKKSS